MAAIVTIKNLVVNPYEVVVYATIQANSAQVTNGVIYDSSVVATALGIADPLKCTLLSVTVQSGSALGIGNLLFDASTPVLACAAHGGSGSNYQHDYEPIGGLPNYAGSGITGDITYTSLALEAAAGVSIVLRVRPH